MVGNTGAAGAEANLEDATVNEIRRAKIDAYVTVLLQLHKEISKIHQEEDQDYLDRTPRFQPADEGRASGGAAHDLMNATHWLEEAIEALDKVAGAGKG